MSDRAGVMPSGRRNRPTRVLGVDAAGRAGWIGIVVDGDGFAGAVVDPSLAGLITAAEPVVTVGVDIPIGSTPLGLRAADRAARAFVGSRASTVFTPPPPEVWDLDYEAANRWLAGRDRPRLSKQAWNLLPRIREADGLARHDRRLTEIHPEVCFTALAGAPAPSKKTWAGTVHRRRVLADHGIVLPDDLGAAGAVPTDDVLDAAAVAWSARRVARGEATSLPDRPEAGVDGRPVAVWY